MKRLALVFSLGTLSSGVIFASTCDDYYQKLESSLRSNGSYSEDVMQSARNQVQGIPAEQQDTFCAAAIESMDS